ncbi:MaoC family dehydratase N-terminal domain-containing protein [Roseobacter sp. YSTF-M11]|uniref:MaoC family dehydratase N-terminal domain-containing protein n=1 Tax=Roseobacter insulae TaxID=2859783 RepID=A0A9X1FX54_9RHOB|nr:MaoC family dehydratase N-terminal domain-containing protein [Roseobacter insulae]MBW4709282.1 MaoC family dehydratase N-terminal domain-containing protein [Roseobacter insulae]
MTPSAPDPSAWSGLVDVPPADIVTPRLFSGYAATFGGLLADVGQTVTGLRCCLFPPMVSKDGLGMDGHPVNGGFVPPILLPRRMWAGEEGAFLRALTPGATLRKTSTIKDATEKTGPSGAVCFLFVLHKYETRGRIALRDLQTIAFREMATRMAAPRAAPANLPRSEFHQPFAGTPIPLFRYSALTSTTTCSAREVAFSPGLVIHGPLQASALVIFASKVPGAVMARHALSGEMSGQQAG